MSIFLSRADFEYASREAGIEDFTRDGEGYANTATQATYRVWLSAAQPVGHTPLSWAVMRGGKVLGIVPTRPTGPESPDWPRKRAQGWETARPVYIGPPGVSHEVMAVIEEHQRQRLEEGYSIQGDVEQYHRGELLRAAACYALQAAGVYPMRYAGFWPFKSKMKTCLADESRTKAVALMLAELERAKAQSQS